VTCADYFHLIKIYNVIQAAISAKSLLNLNRESFSNPSTINDIAVNNHTIAFSESIILQTYGINLI